MSNACNFSTQEHGFKDSLGYPMNSRSRGSTLCDSVSKGRTVNTIRSYSSSCQTGNPYNLTRKLLQQWSSISEVSEDKSQGKMKVQMYYSGFLRLLLLPEVNAVQIQCREQEHSLAICCNSIEGVFFSHILFSLKSKQFNISKNKLPLWG